LKLKIVTLCMLLLLAATANASEKSVSLGEHTFTADLPDEWKTFDDFSMHEVNDGNENSYSADVNDGYSWKGFMAEPWYYPLYPNAPKGDDYYGHFSSVVNLYVLTIPADLKKDQLDENIRVYGSADKIPDDQKEKDVTKILTDAAPPYLSKELRDYSDKDINFSDHTAHLAEMTTASPLNSDDRTSSGRIAILLDENTIGVIDVSVEQFSPSGKFFDGTAWDVINSITVN